jgi:hypothetical protein
MNKSIIVAALTLVLVSLGALVSINHHNSSLTTSENSPATNESPPPTPSVSSSNSCDETCIQQAQDAYDQSLSDQASQAQDDFASTNASDSGGCYPLSDRGNCYEAGEYCRSSDEYVTGVAGNGESIVCTYNNGLRWEPN